MGAVVNLAPERFRFVHAQVPFVDALTTVLDPSLPLTVVEWEEWGNPLEDPAAYALMKSYAPYENVRPNLPRRENSMFIKPVDVPGLLSKVADLISERATRRLQRELRLAGV